MADATLTDVVKKLEEVKSAVKAGDKVTAGAAAKAEEAGAEKSREDAAMKKIFEQIRDRLGMKGGGKGGTGGSKSNADGGGTGILDVFGGLYFVKEMKAAVLGLTTLMGTSFFGKGGLFRNLKASFLTTSKKLFGKTGLKLLLNGLKIGSRLAGLAAVILMPVIDGIFGFFNAEEYGVSKISGVLGGVLAGGEGGIMNAFMNAGKWAAIGASIGVIAGPPGIIAGGLLGAALGGILGLIGGKTVAQSFDKVGIWFTGIFDTVVDSISKVWHAVMPKWFTDIDFAWTDIFPTGLVKLFTGEYFTVDVPDFSWYSLFPNFLVEWFKGTAEKLSEKPFSWTDLLPKVLVDFFTGEIAKPEYSFSWKDLLPTFITDLIDAGTAAFKETPFTWYSLLPDFLVNLVKGVKIKEGSFEWTDLLPGWITKIIGAGKEAGTTEEGGFDWTLLMPSWMSSAWDSTKAIAESAFNWASLLPGWLSAAWGDAKATGKSMAEGTFDWKALLPTWLHGAFDSSVAIKEKLTAFDWKSLLPDWMAAAWGGAGDMAKEAGIDSLWVMIKKIFTDLLDNILGLIPGKETLDKVMKAAEDPVGFAKDAASSGFKFLKSAVGFGDDKPEGKARGGFIVNKPTYLPSSGIVVGEHGTYSGNGAAYGGIADGGPEAVIPLGSSRAAAFIDPMAQSVAGQVMNRLQMERVSGGAGSDASVVTGNDMSTNQVSNNTTVINNPSPIGPRLPDEGRDFVSKVA